MRRIYKIVRREMGILRRNPIYMLFMVVMPIVAVLFFTTLLSNGQPTEMPVGIVDQDYTPITRRMARLLDAFQTTRIVGQYATVSDARRAVQRGEIYAFLYVPKGTSAKLLASRKPTISFYYSMTSMTSGSLLFRDLKTISSLGNAGLMQATLRMRGATDDQIMTYLQPITIDLHQIANPTLDYNAYLSTTLVPGVLTLFLFLLAAYSLGTELKFETGRNLLLEAGDNIWVALTGKLLPLYLVSLAIFFFYEIYVYYFLGFPHLGGPWPILWLGLLTVHASLGFGIFMFGMFPQLRMSMSICSLWAVLSFSAAGSIFPVENMDTPLQAMTWLFPLRHYFMVYQAVVFNGYPVTGVWIHVVMLIGFALLPLFVFPRIKKALKYYVYVP
ncbi:MAG: ABC transporter permease [Bacteroidaceae bacterium]|nr:ABC transporter permease [Bacteroidaceae bacterium]